MQNYNSPPPPLASAEDQETVRLIEKLNLYQDEVIRFTKRLSEQDYSNSFHVGVLSQTVSKNKSLCVKLPHTTFSSTEIQKIYETERRFFIKTQNSIYEVLSEESKEKVFDDSIESTIEKTNKERVIEVLLEIESSLAKQPKSIQDHFLENREKMTEYRKFGNTYGVFSANINDTVISYVFDPDENHYVTRAFRLSGSDHQFKSLPGYRTDGKVLKGDENNPNHHYVQSAKLTPEVYSIIQSLPIISKQYQNTESLLPILNVQYMEELEFTENKLIPRKESWQLFQRLCTFGYAYYEYCGKFESLIDFSTEGSFYKNIKVHNFENLYPKAVEQIEKLSESPETKELLQKSTLRELAAYEGGAYKEFCDFVYRLVLATVSELPERINLETPEDIVPDFIETNIIATYRKIESGSYFIDVEEFQVNNEEGDILVFAMARDSQNRVYIDNIYDPRVKTITYGTYKEVFYAGILVYKPEDYYQQTGHLLPQYKTQQDYSDYIDISAYWQKFTIVAKYTESLKNRNMLSQNKNEA